ncbi:MAG: transferase, partial [Muribaculaceae bacterium]|nr:transferase [Muribaculaceae bacterium]
PIHISLVWGSEGDMSLRRKLIERYRHQPTETLVASTAVITPHSSIGTGCAVMHRAVINGASIGDYSIVNTGAIIEHGVILGENVFVGPGAVICGNAVIGNDCIIGAGAIIKNGVSIVAGTVIGLGAAVISDVTVSGVYSGIPAKEHNRK